MKTPLKHDSSRTVTRLVRQRVEDGGERLWRLEDFKGYPFTAVAQALSRLTMQGVLERLSKGTYYRPRKTAFGPSRPNPTNVRKLADKKLFPSGTTAANLLGFTTQVAKHNEMATTAASLPRKLVGENVKVHTRRPAAWSKLNETEAALLDFLRNGGGASELSPEETVKKTLLLLSEQNTFNRLTSVAATEPPRVRALLGALGESLNADKKTLNRLRASLNSLSRFDFGLFSVLPNSRTWQAKD